MQTSPAPEELFTPATVVPYLRERGLVGPHAHAAVLGGGVSNVVLGVSDESTSLVLKQALPKLRVAMDWQAPRSRVLTEAEALELAHRLTPERVPRLLDCDPARFAICLERAPAGWTDWKTALLAGEVNDEVAVVIARALAAWHSQTSGGSGLSPRMLDPTAFEQLRLDPYFRTLAAREPRLATKIEEVVSSLEERRLCLTHGDFSPKNILVGPGDGQVWVLDFEVAHLGDPAFDLAFLLTHLVLKSIHTPQHRERLDHCARAFAEGYEDAAARDLRPDWVLTVRYVAALLLSRVKGKSPAEYLTPAQAEQVWRLGLALIDDRGADISSVLAHREKVLA